MRFTVMGAKTPVETSQILFLNFLYAFSCVRLAPVQEDPNMNTKTSQDFQAL